MEVRGICGGATWATGSVVLNYVSGDRAPRVSRLPRHVSLEPGSLRHVRQRPRGWAKFGDLASLYLAPMNRIALTRFVQQLTPIAAPALTDDRRLPLFRRMATPPRAYQLWHFSRGISFTGSSPLQPSVAASTTINVDLAKEAPIPKEDDGSTRFIAPALAPTTNVRPLVAEAESVNVEAPSTSLDYRIPENIFQKARKAAKGTPDSFWTYSLYRGPLQDGEPRKVKVHYCLSKHTTERVCQYFMNEKIIGFDMEWMSYASKDHGPKPNVSLIQIASESRIGLFHVALYKGKYNDELVAPSLKRLLEDPEISKAGVNIKADCTRLNNFLGIKTRGIFELSHLHKLTKYSASGELNLIDKRVVNMASQVQEHLRLPMFKGNDVRMSNWMQPLTLSQILCECSCYIHCGFSTVLSKRQIARLTPTPPSNSMQ